MSLIKHRVVKRVGSKKDIMMCWSCGHWSKIIDGRCDCCHLTVRQRSREDVEEVMINIKECLDGNKEPEYRFYTSNRVYWIKKGILEEFNNLESSSKSEKYYHWILNAVETGKITNIIRF